MEQVLVTGGTGNLGKWLTGYLLEKNYGVSVLSTRENLPRTEDIEIFNGDLAKNIGLVQATEKADIIIHCASDPGRFEETDIQGTRNLLNSINKERTRQVVYISIVGVDKSDYPYYKAKYAVEKIIAGSGIPYTILRTTQFHPFVLSMLRSFVKEPVDSVVNIPRGMRFQSVDIREVAKKLVGCLEKAEGLLPDFGGPEVLRFEEMVRLYLDITAANPVILPADIPGPRYDLFRSGVNLCPDNALGTLTWQEFLEETYAAK